jgi:hypothetical protein
MVSGTSENISIVAVRDVFTGRPRGRPASFCRRAVANCLMRYGVED